MDKRHNRAVKAYHDSEYERWKCCMYAYRIVGQRDGRTAAFAGAIGRSISMVENYAHAAEVMLILRTFGVGAKLRRKLTISHYYTMWELQRKHNLPWSEIYEELMTAAHEGIDARQMGKAVDEMHGGGITLEKRLNRIANDAKYIITDDVPARLYRIMVIFLRWYESWKKSDHT